MRPERVRIERLTGAIAQSADNLATGTLTDIIYLGNARRHRPFDVGPGGQHYAQIAIAPPEPPPAARGIGRQWNRGEYPNRNIADAEFHRKASKKHAR